MTLGIFLLVSLATAVGLCLGNLWLLPLCFLGAAVGYFLLLVLFVLIVAALVRKDQPRQRDNGFYRWVVYRAIDLVLPLIRYRVHTQGFEKAPAENRVLIVCNHLHGLDPAILLKCFRAYRPAFISKKENDRLPVVAPFLHQLLCQSIDRENDRQALKVILNCIQLLKDQTVSIAVFPEGHRSADGNLQEFRSGVFKIAQRAGVPIVVCTLQNTQYGIHNALQLKPTDIHLHLVSVLMPEELTGLTATQISDQVHALMVKDLKLEK